MGPQPLPPDPLAPPATPLIDTRDELIVALTEASELEHGLLLQYLFAAYTMKKSTAEALAPAQFELVRRWERVLLTVAHQEMAHLGTVCNMLTAIGAGPRFARPNFPQGREGAFRKLTDSLYPFDFQLERFGASSVDRFVAAETPTDVRADADGFELLAPEPLQFDRLGELYRQIADGFRRVDADLALRGERLFIGPPEAQDRSRWALNLNLLGVVDAPTAVAAIGSIVLEGEGAPADHAGSHYQRFLGVREELAAASAAAPDFVPARPVASNPMTRRPRDAGDGPISLIASGTPAAAVAELFDFAYATTLLALTQFYDFAGETDAQRAGLQASARQSMSAVLRPIAEILTTLPLGDGSAETAGPGFALYADPQVPSHMPSRWILLVERLQAATGEASRLAGEGPEPLRRLAFVAENLRLLTGNVRRLAGGGG